MVTVQMNTLQLPEADCALYDFSGRNHSRDNAIGYLYDLLRSKVDGKAIYWYTFDKGYSAYKGEQLIVYRITEESGYSTDFSLVLHATEANGYRLNTIDHGVKKMVITTIDWSNKDFIIWFNLGIDDDDYKKLIDDAWKGLKHEWRTSDGLLLSNADRLAALYYLEPKIKFTPAKRKERKPKFPLNPIKRKRSNLVYLTREKGSISAYFDFRL